ncbi:hypothetical protein ACFPRL_12945 [Pseudoclavibacter helvolus]
MTLTRASSWSSARISRSKRSMRTILPQNSARVGKPRQICRRIAHSLRA